MQLPLFHARFELPPMRMTWREGERIVIIERGERCMDMRWPWWRPSPPKVQC